MDTDYEEDVELESETQILAWRTLIEIVKANPVLYEKKLKGYSKRNDKVLKWNEIGASLIPPMTGIAAEKEFYRLRQKFGKERRKVLQSQARSGAGGNNVAYKSNWILYNDLMFLADYIQPRQTTSNYQRPVTMHQKISNLQASQQLVTSTPLTYPSTCTPSSSSNKSSEFWNTFEFLSGSATIEDEKLSSMGSEDSCLSAAPAPSKSSTSSGNTSPSVLKAMASAIIPQKQTPPLDTVKKRKRGSADEMDAIMLQSSKNVSLLASTLETMLKEQTSTPTTSQQLPGVSPAVQSMMGSIALGLSKIPVECQMDCLISVLSCIKEFTNK